MVLLVILTPGSFVGAIERFFIDFLSLSLRRSKLGTFGKEVKYGILYTFRSLLLTPIPCCPSSFRLGLYPPRAKLVIQRHLSSLLDNEQADIFERVQVGSFGFLRSKKE